MTFLDQTPEQHERLREVFALVRDPENWKMPIRAFVPDTAATAAEISDAVIFFCGGNPEIQPATKGGVNGWAVTGAGYYEWIGA